MLKLVIYFNFMSTQVEAGNEEGMLDHDDNLIDSLIDDVHFDDLV